MYASDGRLIGAVSYGLAFGPSAVAGVTPAEDMQALLGGTASNPTAQAMAGSRHVSLPVGMQRQLVADELASPSEASQGLDRLPLPLAVSGMANSKRLNQAAARLGLSDIRLYRSGSAPADPPAETDIFAGSNLAASMSHGDFSVAAIGTTTMVCNEQVVGFGHPLNWSGDSTYAMHGADSIYIQQDPTAAGFKVANPSGPVGEITGDHLAGISGPLGPSPATTWVRSTVSMADGMTRTGDSYISVPDVLPDAATMAEVSNQDRVFDRFGKGSSMLHFVVNGHTTPGGKSFTFARTNRFDSPYDISYDTVNEFYEDMLSILYNRFTHVTIGDVRITTQISPDQRRFNLGKVQQLVGGRYVTLTGSSIVRAKAGSIVTLHVTLNSPYNEFGSKVETLHLTVPNGRVGSSGWLVVGRWRSSPGASSFDGLLTKLANAPRNDQLQGQINVNRGLRRTNASTLVGDVFSGTKSFQFRISS